MRAVIAAALRRLAHALEPAPPVTQQVVHYHYSSTPITTTPMYPQPWQTPYYHSPTITSNTTGGQG
jgi:hypothetical protein